MALAIPLHLPRLSWPPKGHCRPAPGRFEPAFELIGDMRQPCTTGLSLSAWSEQRGMV
jgi:hypothetical protein